MAGLQRRLFSFQNHAEGPNPCGLASLFSSHSTLDSFDRLLLYFVQFVLKNTERADLRPQSQKLYTTHYQIVTITLFVALAFGMEGASYRSVIVRAELAGGWNVPSP
jgi:hypothetical protein